MSNEARAVTVERPLAITILAVIAMVMGSYDLFFEALLLFRPDTPFIQNTVAWYARVADTTYVSPDAATLAFTTINVFWSVPFLILTGIGLLRMRRWGFLLGIGQFFMINYGNTYDFLVDYWDGFSKVRNLWVVFGVGMVQFTLFSIALLYYLLKYEHLFGTQVLPGRSRGSLTEVRGG
jgi:hypothetical protein